MSKLGLIALASLAAFPCLKPAGSAPHASNAYFATTIPINVAYDSGVLKADRLSKPYPAGTTLQWTTSGTTLFRIQFVEPACLLAGGAVTEKPSPTPANSASCVLAGHSTTYHYVVIDDTPGAPAPQPATEKHPVITAHCDGCIVNVQ